jgi:hypothetical protein
VTLLYPLSRLRERVFWGCFDADEARRVRAIIEKAAAEISKG